MRKSRFRDEQVVRILREAERDNQKIAELCRKYGITETTFYRWRKKLGGMGVAEVKRLKALEQENQRLKRRVADRDLEIDALKELLSKTNW